MMMVFLEVGCFVGFENEMVYFVLVFVLVFVL